MNSSQERGNTNAEPSSGAISEVATTIERILRTEGDKLSLSELPSGRRICGLVGAGPGKSEDNHKDQRVRGNVQIEVGQAV